MKIKQISTAMAMIMSFAFVGAQAATTRGPQVKTGTPEVGRYAKCARHMSDLNLTETQKSQAKSILQESKDQAKLVRENASLTPEQKKARMKEIKRAGYDQFRQILTPEQQRTLDQKRTRGEQRVKALKAKVQDARKELNLRPEQEARIKELMAARKDEVKALKADTRLTPEQKRAEFKKMKDSVKAEVRRVLDPEQQKKYDAMTEKAEKRFAEWQKTRARAK